MELNRTLSLTENFEQYLFRFHDWQSRNWSTCFYAIFVYLLLIAVGKIYMEKRKRYELKNALIFWNLMLSVFSVCGMFGLGAQMFKVLYHQGFRSLVCNPAHTDGENFKWVFWGLLFVNSKFLELGDTAFVILRKQPLLFLHYYHHITALLYCVYSVQGRNPPALPFAVINLTIHGYMYFYYTLKAAKVYVPRVVSMGITVSQILQMVAAVSVSCYCIAVKLSGQYCGVSDDSLRASFLLYFSYAVLFSRFFYRAYFGKKPVAEVKTLKQS